MFKCSKTDEFVKSRKSFFCHSGERQNPVISMLLDAGLRRNDSPSNHELALMPFQRFSIGHPFCVRDFYLESSRRRPVGVVGDDRVVGPDET